MNQLAANNERLPMDSVGMSTGSTGMKIAPQNLAEVVKFAEVMCRADIALPKHLRGNAGACMAVSLQALDWQMNPFAVASKSYQVNGTIAYEAQLIIAVINTRSGIEGRLKFKFEGEGPDRICIAYGKLDGDELEVRSPRFKDITPKNSPLWKSDPDQQHCYYTARAWGRRYTPEVILGVYDRDEAEQFQGADNARDITPSRPSLSDRLQQASIAPQTPQDAREGFSATFDRGEPEFVSAGEYDDNTNSDDIPTSEDAAMPAASEAGEPAPSEAPASTNLIAEDDLSRDDTAKLVECAVKLFAITRDESLTALKRRDALAMAKETWKAALDERLHEKLKSIFVSADAVIRGNADYAAATEVFADMLECNVETIRGEA